MTMAIFKIFIIEIPKENIIWLLLVWHYLLPLSLTPLHPQPMLIETISFMIQFLANTFFSNSLLCTSKRDLIQNSICSVEALMVSEQVNAILEPMN